MATNKKSFILYTDITETIQHLSDESAGKLFKIILDYVNDKNPEPDDMILKIAFAPIKTQLKRDLKKWEGEIENKSLGGRMGNLKRWNIDLYDKVIKKAISIEEAEKIAYHRIASHTDEKNRIPSDSIASVAVNDSVSVSVNDIYIGDCEIKNPTVLIGNIEKELLKEENREFLKLIYSRTGKDANNGKRDFRAFHLYYTGKGEPFTRVKLFTKFESWLLNPIYDKNNPTEQKYSPIKNVTSGGK